MYVQRCNLSGLVATLLAFVVGASSAFAALPKLDTIVPATTRVYISCPNLNEFDAAVRRTKLGGIFQEPALQPFFDDVERQIDERLAESQQVLGLGLEDFQGLSDKEAAFAVVDLGVDQAGQPQTGTVVLVDISGHEAQLPAVRQKIAAALAKRNAQAAALAVQSGASGTQYDIPPRTPGNPNIVMIEAVHQSPAGSLWIIADRAPIVEVISAALAAGNNPASLATNGDYQKIVQVTSPAPGEPTSHLVAYVDPLGLIAALRAYEFPPKKHKPDSLKVFKDAGFESLKGIGGQATFGVGDFGVVLRVFMLAPPPYTKSMQMLTFPPGNEFAPQQWVAGDAVAYATAYWDVQKAFDNFDPVFDGFLDDEGIWQDVLRSLREDRNGPQIDIRAEFVALLGHRLTAVVDHKLPPQSDSSRGMVAMEIRHVTAEEIKQRAAAAGMAVPDDAQAAQQAAAESAQADATVAGAVEKMFKDDKGAKLIEVPLVEGQPPLRVWEMTVTEKVPPGAANQEGVVNGMREVLKFYITTHAGHVFLASGTEILQKTLGPESGPRLANAADYVALTDRLGEYISTEATAPVALGFTRLDELVRVDYELFRAGKLAQADTLVGQLLDLSMQMAEREGRELKPIDGSKLPPFETIQKYFSPAGALISNRPDGLFGIGLTLEKSLPAAAAGAATPAGTGVPAPVAAPTSNAKNGAAAASR